MESQANFFERYLKRKGAIFDIYDANLKGPNISNQLPDQTILSSYEMIYEKKIKIKRMKKLKINKRR